MSMTPGGMSVVGASGTETLPMSSVVRGVATPKRSHMRLDSVQPRA